MDAILATKIVIAIVIIVCVILLTRLFGAWMLRIDEIIKYLRWHGEQNKEIIGELKKLNGKKVKSNPNSEN